ncbi:MAG TPA: SDR family oxidoreductase [Gammaproteobacteria bacterium]|jgi:3-oxoacyl-[acyl-carrier protein] reductase|nr:SDR family oxidoreductase [Gammaproteobacteria bacterium]HIB75886.1 SDR family oxidoreductase [Gammaproteobacteria bacterium]HIG50520.1 SDR family oxidoreductase [Gammaproteobacteria bacterium]HIM22398.1 SDR family oxidoreductase [Gammaproteobacteria bacterium]HIN73441.1 SDR family oxidoreductase [Gammaproteobacteria bacterium]
MTKLTKLSRSVEGKVALITGSGSGMGRATSYVFAEAGAKVVVSDINKKQIEEVSSEINSSNGTCLKQILDVTNQENINEVIANVIKEFGQLDILINNAGISIPTTIDDENYEESWDRTFNVLLKGQVNLIRAALPFIRESDCGRIVNISSTEGLGATPRISPYTSAKHGVIGLTRSLAVELGSQGITVNCICPGPINTAMTAAIPIEDKQIYARRRVPLKRYGEPEEVAHMTLSLCLPAASFVNGAVLPVDGGLSIKRA